MDDVIADKDLLDKIQACQNEIATAQFRIKNYKKEIASNKDVRAGWETAVLKKEAELAAHLSGVDAGEAGKNSKLIPSVSYSGPCPLLY